jgi:hypothetical protein
MVVKTGHSAKNITSPKIAHQHINTATAKCIAVLKVQTNQAFPQVNKER